jgi:hypothetical protein
LAGTLPVNLQHICQFLDQKRSQEWRLAFDQNLRTSAAKPVKTGLSFIKIKLCFDSVCTVRRLFVLSLRILFYAQNHEINRYF